MDRRSFLRNAVAGAVTAAAQPGSAGPSGHPATAKMIGIQVGAVSFVDEGVDKGLFRVPGGWTLARSNWLEPGAAVTAAPPIWARATSFSCLIGSYGQFSS